MIERMSFDAFRKKTEELLRAEPTLDARLASGSDPLAALFQAVAEATDEDDAIRRVRLHFNRLPPGLQVECVRAAFDDPSDAVAPLRRFIKQLPADAQAKILAFEDQKIEHRIGGGSGQDSSGVGDGSPLAAQRIEDLMTDVWTLIAETRYLFGGPPSDWRAPKETDRLDFYAREHPRWGGSPEFARERRRTLATYIDGSPCSIVEAGEQRMRRARAIMKKIQESDTGDEVTVRDRFMNVSGKADFKEVARRCSVAETLGKIAEEEHRLAQLAAQGSRLFAHGQEEFNKQYSKRLFRNYSVAIGLLERAAERGIFEAQPLLDGLRSTGS